MSNGSKCGKPMYEFYSLSRQRVEERCADCAQQARREEGGEAKFLAMLDDECQPPVHLPDSAVVIVPEFEDTDGDPTVVYAGDDGNIYIFCREYMPFSGWSVAMPPSLNRRQARRVAQSILAHLDRTGKKRRRP